MLVSMRQKRMSQIKEILFSYLRKKERSKMTVTVWLEQCVLVAASYCDHKNYRKMKTKTKTKTKLQEDGGM